MESFLERQRVPVSKFSDAAGAPWRNEADQRRRDGLLRSEPPGDGDLLVGVELDRVLPVRLEVAEEAALGSAEREEGHRRRDADVHPQHAGLDLPTIVTRRLAAAREDAAGVAEIVTLPD